MAIIRDQVYPKDVIDYDKLTPTQQARWDAGLFGWLSLKTINGSQYYYLGWRNPATKRLHTHYLGKDWDVAITKVRAMTCGGD
jgi:hypothetical protein